jgi:hypothetical protein
VEDRLMSVPLKFPSLFVPKSVLFHLVPQNNSGPRAASGKSQVRATDAGFWRASVSFDIHTADEIREWRGFVAALQGKVTEFNIGVFDDRQAPAAVGGSHEVTGITHSDDTTFSDGTGYSQSDILVVATSAVELRATAMTLTVTRAGDLKRGMYFSHRDGFRHHLYMVTSVTSADGATIGITFLPPARAAIAAGDAIEFGTPQCTMNLADQMSGQLTMERNYRGAPSLEMEESFNGLA